MTHFKTIKKRYDKAKAARKKQRDSKRKQEEHSNGERNDNEPAQDTVFVKHKKDASTTNTVGEQRMVPIRHPRLPNTMPPRYFVNKDGVVCSKTKKGEFRELKPIKRGTNDGSYVLTVEKASTFKLEEIMVYTFSENQYNSDKQYIFHKDGNRENCAWSNLAVYDNLAPLQEQEIARLEMLYPGTKYAVVRDVHDTLTFERYLISNTGNVYSLIRRVHLRPRENECGYVQFQLHCDTNADQTVRHKVLFLSHSLVMRSFKGRHPEDLAVTHIYGDRRDNMLENLLYADHTKKTRRPRKKTQAASEEQRKASTTLPPLPPVTDETKWKTVGVIPWTGLSFSQYEVSDMGHARHIGGSRLLKLTRQTDGYTGVRMYHDNQDLKTRPKYMRMARLVAYAFVDGYSETQNIVKHINRDRLDNRAQNLEWVSRGCSSFSRKARQVIVSPVDDPKTQKKFSSLNKAQCELSDYSLFYWISKYGDSFTKEVSWDGEKKMALIHVLAPAT
ncbi:hypothetical protein BJV82DRAFT_615257 [Fennellomyces sp. T-0311]|nr:hypothetical protein BJV82DRAFT_615257 [Fennellomyces sp. T-0311]